MGEKIDFGSVLTHSSKILFNNLKIFLPITIIFSIPMQVLLIIFSLTIGFDLPVTPPKVIVIIILMIIGVLQVCFINGVVMVGTQQFQNGQNIEIKTCLRKSLSSLFQNFIALLILFVMGTAGLVFFIIPGFYIAIRFSLIMEIITFEKSSIIGSFKRSWELTKGNAWQVIGIIVVLTILTNNVDKILAKSEIFNLPYIDIIFNFFVQTLVYTFSYILYCVFYLETIKQEENALSISSDKNDSECSNKIELSFE